jgi:hypothetical protein
MRYALESVASRTSITGGRPLASRFASAASGKQRCTAHRTGAAIVMAIVAASMSGACGNDHMGPTPVAGGIRLVFDDPVVAQFVQVTGVFVAEFPVTIVDETGRGGQLLFLETMVYNRSRNILMATNQRPNGTYGFPQQSLPARGELNVYAGIGFAPPPPRDEIVITVRVRLTDGRETERAASVRQVYPPS